MELLEGQGTDLEPSAGHLGLGVEDHPVALAPVVQPVHVGVASELGHHRLDAHLGSEDIGHHVADGDGAEAEAVGVLGQGVVRPSGVEERLEVLHQVETAGGRRPVHGQGVGARPRAGDQGVDPGDAVADAAHLGPDGGPVAADHLAVPIGVAVVAVVEVQHAGVPGSLESFDQAQGGGVAARAGTRRGGHPADGERLAAFRVGPRGRPGPGCENRPRRPAAARSRPGPPRIAGSPCGPSAGQSHGCPRSGPGGRSRWCAAPAWSGSGGPSDPVSLPATVAEAGPDAAGWPPG